LICVNGVEDEKMSEWLIGHNLITGNPQMVEICTNLEFCFTWWGLLMGGWGLVCIFLVPVFIVILIKNKKKIFAIKKICMETVHKPENGLNKIRGIIR